MIYLGMTVEHRIIDLAGIPLVQRWIIELDIISHKKYNIRVKPYACIFDHMKVFSSLLKTINMIFTFIEHIFKEQRGLKPSSSVSLIICGHQKDYVTSFVLSFHEAYNEMTLYFYFFRETLVQKWWMAVIESVCVN